MGCNFFSTKEHMCSSKKMLAHSPQPTHSSQGYARKLISLLPGTVNLRNGSHWRDTFVTAWLSPVGFLRWHWISLKIHISHLWRVSCPVRKGMSWILIKRAYEWENTCTREAPAEHPCRTACNWIDSIEIHYLGSILQHAKNLVCRAPQTSWVTMVKLESGQAVLRFQEGAGSSRGDRPLLRMLIFLMDSKGGPLLWRQMALWHRLVSWSHFVRECPCQLFTGRWWTDSGKRGREQSLEHGHAYIQAQKATCPCEPI